MPTPSWTVSFTMPTASNSPAKACAGHEANRTRRLDQPPSPVTQIHRPARLATRAASFRYGGRHHSGIPGDIIPLYPGDFVGIRSIGDNIDHLAACLKKTDGEICHNPKVFFVKALLQGEGEARLSLLRAKAHQK